MAGGARLPRLGLGTCLLQGDEAYAARLPVGPTSYDVRGPRRRGGVATQRPAKPCTPVRFRSAPSLWQAVTQRRTCEAERFAPSAERPVVPLRPDVGQRLARARSKDELAFASAGELEPSVAGRPDEDRGIAALCDQRHLEVLEEAVAEQSAVAVCAEWPGDARGPQVCEKGRRRPAFVSVLAGLPAGRSAAGFPVLQAL